MWLVIMCKFVVCRLILLEQKSWQIYELQEKKKLSGYLHLVR